jgi:hypothetical protein
VVAPGEDQTTAGIVLALLVHRGNEHRAHATAIFGSHGQTMPKIGVDASHRGRHLTKRWGSRCG